MKILLQTFKTILHYDLSPQRQNVFINLACKNLCLRILQLKQTI